MTQQPASSYFRKPLSEVTEAHLKEKVKDLCKKYGAWYGMPVAGPYGKSGLPDFIIGHPVSGRLIGVETKTMKGRLTELQKHTLDAMIRSRCVALVIKPDNLHDLEDLLSKE